MSGYQGLQTTDCISMRWLNARKFNVIAIQFMLNSHPFARQWSCIEQ
ncbi:hypothetical protein WP3W19E03_11160 [Aeromonas veronii]|uniref:Uncharacterized protein n=1 Tax=Aeromonas veronii TaxID=654 RepID=A0A6S5X1Q3_AERVE|nr:hypothetical protein WP3W19E03_11160 [Aeromonas veronii]BBT81644.1 hypothetical protein WP8S18E11_33100 [Aeromonas veronii]